MNIVKRLRQHALPDPHDEREVMHAPLLKEAADLIEQQAERIKELEAEKQEPVAWLNKKISYMSVLTKPDDGGGWFPVFTTPQPAIPAGWQPIETAPKDGSDFLAYNPMTRKHVVVFWKHDAWIFPELVFSSSITHWMPLPAAPKQENSHD